jgi:16S rRNA processing protein RimM
MAAPDDVVVGVIGKPHGLNGDVYVRPDPDVGDEFPPGSTYQVTPADRSHPETLTVVSSHLHSGRRVVRFEGITDRDTAAAVRGLVLTIPRGEAQLEEGAFWAADLLGREVVDEDGTLLGVIEGVRDGHAHDYLLLARTDGGEVLLPAVDDLLDITADRVVVRVIPGLLEE